VSCMCLMCASLVLQVDISTVEINVIATFISIAMMFKKLIDLLHSVSSIELRLFF